MQHASFLIFLGDSLTYLFICSSYISRSYLQALFLLPTIFSSLISLCVWYEFYPLSRGPSLPIMMFDIGTGHIFSLPFFSSFAFFKSVTYGCQKGGTFSITLSLDTHFTYSGACFDRAYSDSCHRKPQYLFFSFLYIRACFGAYIYLFRIPYHFNFAYLLTKYYLLHFVLQVLLQQ